MSSPSTRRDSSSRCGAGRLSAARSWRRSARRWPKCVRSRWTRVERGMASGPCSSRNCASGPPRGLRQAVRVHARAGLLHADGLFDRAASVDPGEDLHRLREVSTVPALRPVRDGPAARLDRATRSIATCRSSRVTHERADRSDRSKRSPAASRRREGFRAAGVSAGIKAQAGALDLALIVSDRPATAAAVFTTNRAEAAPVSSRAITWRGRAAWRAPSSSTAAAPMPAPVTTGCRRANGMAIAHRRLRRVPGRSGARRLDRRHWRRAADGQDPRGAAGGGSRAWRRPADRSPRRRS